MYGWIWRKLPGGLAGKLAGSVLLLVGVLALMWFWLFPALEPLLPFDDVRVGGQNVGTTQSPTPDQPVVSAR